MRELQKHFIVIFEYIFLAMILQYIVNNIVYNIVNNIKCILTQFGIHSMFIYFFLKYVIHKQLNYADVLF